MRSLIAAELLKLRSTRSAWIPLAAALAAAVLAVIATASAAGHGGNPPLSPAALPDLPCEGHQEPEEARARLPHPAEIHDKVLAPLVEKVPEIPAGVNIARIVHQPGEVTQDDNIAIEPDVDGHFLPRKSSRSR